MAKFFDTDIEKKVLAGMLHDDEVLEYASINIESTDFENADLAYLFDVFIRFYRKYYKRITGTILSTWLSKNAPKKKTSSMLLFTEIDAVGTDDYSRYYINELKTYATKRKLYDIHDRITGGLNEDEDPDTLFTEVSRAILTGGQTSLVYRTSIFDDPEGRVRLYEDKRDHPEKYRGVPYGIAEIDALTGGMYTGQLYMIIGRTSAGKSRMLFNIGSNVALSGKAVMYCTIEMEAAIIQHMWESRQTSIPFQYILRATLSAEDEKKYLDFIRKSKDTQVPFHIVDIPQGCTTSIIDSEVVMFEKLHGKVPDIVLIDYANLISPIARFKDRAEKYDHVFRELKEGSRAHKTVYYTAAQMNRESLKTKEPGTEHIAFSDAAAYHCDAVFRVFADKNMIENRELQLDVIKGRYHEKATITLHWNRETNMISSYGSVKTLGHGHATHHSGSAGSVQPTEPATVESLEDY